MKQRAVVGVAMLLTLGAVAGCAHSDDAGTPTTVGSAEFASAEVQSRDLFVADTGVETAPRMTSIADWSFNVNDPAALRDFSSAVVSGMMIGVERSYVSANATVVTAYSVRVERVYKGENIADVISVTLPGGTVTLGEYIESLDELGLYEMKFGKSDPQLRGEAGLDPNEEHDPRRQDPSTPVTENWGVNPASASMVTELQPESWVFYIHTEDNIYYGAGFDHALSYLKDGLVYGLHPEGERSPVPEDDLFEK